MNNIPARIFDWRRSLFKATSSSTHSLSEHGWFHFQRLMLTLITLPGIIHILSSDMTFHWNFSKGNKRKLLFTGSKRMLGSKQPKIPAKKTCRSPYVEGVAFWSFTQISHVLKTTFTTAIPSQLLTEKQWISTVVVNDYRRRQGHSTHADSSDVAWQGKSNISFQCRAKKKRDWRWNITVAKSISTCKLGTDTHKVSKVSYRKAWSSRGTLKKWW